MQANYYAIENVSANAVYEVLAQSLRGLPASSKCLALLDTAFDFGRTAPQWLTDALPIYHRDTFERLRDVSPVLTPFDESGNEQWARQVARLCAYRSGRPMLSFVVTQASAEELREHWQSFLNVTTADDQGFLLRFADTRVLPALAEGLDPISWRAFTAPLRGWLIINRAGQPEWLALPNEIRTNQAPQPIRLTAHELARLLQRSQPDAVIDFLAEHFADLLPIEGRVALYERVAAACELAIRHRVEAFPDVAALAVAACLTEGAILRDPRLTALLQQHDWSSGSLNESLQQLLPEDTAS